MSKLIKLLWLRMNGANRTLLFPVTLGGLFFLCFGLPFILLNGCQLSGPKLSENQSIESAPGKLGPEVFPESFRIGSGSPFFSVKDGDVLNPSLSNDFLLITWVRLNQMPRLGKRTILFSKFDVQGPGRPGYAVALFRDSNGVRPMVFWQSSKKPGRWLSFAEMRFRPQHWMMLALSFHDHKYLGLHGALIVDGEEPSVELYGGYEFNSTALPDAKSDFRIGSISENSFRGQVGAVLAMQRAELTADLREILSDALRYPLRLPGSVRERDLLFWCLDGTRDLGPGKLEVVPQRRKGLLGTQGL